MSNISVDYDILNQKQTPAFYASSLATRPAFGFPGRIFIDTDTPSSGIYRDTGSAWVQVADPGAGTTGTLQQVTTNGNTTTLGVTIQGININDGAGTGLNNIVIGGGLQSNTTGTQNTAIGIDSLVINTTGFNNTALGGTTLNNNTTGANNTAIGYSSLQANTTGVSNTAIGSNSLSLNTTGANNTAIGGASLTANTTGGSNTAIGYNSLQANTTASYNTAIGNSALGLNSTGAYNTAIGFASLFSNTIGNFNTALGYISLNQNTTGANNVALGSNSLELNTTGGANTGIGYASLSANTTGGNNTALGSQTLKSNTTASFNTAIGNNSLNLNTTGTNNTAVGYANLIANTIGDNNTSLGANALQTNISASDNTAIGSSALSLNTGAQNTAIGNTALQNNSTGASNVAIGHITLQANTTGGANTGVGRGALYQNTTGTFNVGIGYGAGGLITTGSKNSILGSYPGTTTLTNNIVLSDGDANVRLFSDANGLIGINQSVGSVPGGQLDIHSTQTYALVLNGLSTSNAYTAFSNASVGKWRIGNTYNAGANTFDIFNLGTSSNALSINSTTNAATFSGAITQTNALSIGITVERSTGGNKYIEWKNTLGSFYAGITSANNFNIGTNSDIASSSQFVLTAVGNVLIGTTTDDTTAKLQVNGEIRMYGSTLFRGMSSNTLQLCGGTSSSNVKIDGAAEEITMSTNGIARVTLTSAGTFGIGGGNSYGKLDVGGQTNTSTAQQVCRLGNISGLNNGLIISVDTSNNYVYSFGTLGTGTVTATAGVLSVVSDMNLKIEDGFIDNALDKVMNLKPRYYHWKEESGLPTDLRQLGFYAQEVNQALGEEVVNTPKNQNDKWGIYDRGMIAMLTKAIQELNEKLVRNNIN